MNLIKPISYIIISFLSLYAYGKEGQLSGKWVQSANLYADQFCKECVFEEEFKEFLELEHFLSFQEIDSISKTDSFAIAFKKLAIQHKIQFKGDTMYSILNDSVCNSYSIISKENEFTYLDRSRKVKNQFFYYGEVLVLIQDKNVFKFYFQDGKLADKEEIKSTYFYIREKYKLSSKKRNEFCGYK